ncbi:MAG: CotH kinase family protein, partial [Cyclobacteriaceae bacterium]
MLIKQKRPFTTYLSYGTIVLMSLVGGYGLLLQNKPTATVIAKTSDSAASVMLRIKTDAITKLDYTLFGPQDVIRHTQVIGGNHQTFYPEQVKSLPYYPFPKTDTTFPKALVMALTYPWSPTPDVQQAQYTTVLLDSMPLPVLSLSGPPEYFFGEKGFYAVESENSREIPHNIHLELIDRSRGTYINTSAEATVAGYSSKKLPMKSLDLELITPLSSSLVFGGTLQTPMHSLRLRNAGNDFLLAYMRDAVVSALSEPTQANGLHFQPVAVFINGEFWGIQYLREHISEENLREKYPDLDRDQIRLGELHENKVLVTSNGFDYQMGHLMDFMEQTDLHEPEQYDSLAHLMDLPNFIDYLAIQTFVSNSDWPHNNVKGVFLNGKLYFLLYDADFAFAFPKYYQA